MSSAPPAEPSAVLVHGMLVGAADWIENMWGRPPDALGRLPKAVLVARESGATTLVFGTGASRADDGTLEAEHVRRTLLERAPQLATDFGHFFGGWSAAEADAYVRSLTLLTETTSMNTHDEVRAVGALLLARNVTRLTLVSSCTHAPRCMRDALAVYEEEAAAADARGDAPRAAAWRALRSRLCVAPSDVAYVNARAADVCILEPPHRSDQRPYPLHRLAARMYSVPVDERDAFIAEYTALLDRYTGQS